MASKSQTLKAMRASAAAPVPPRLGVRAVIVCTILQVLLLLALMLLFPGVARSEPLKGDIRISTNGGYARLVFTFDEENDADVRLANGIVIISFKKPVDLNVDRITAGAPGYVGVARRDPDGTAVRIALTRKVTVNSMAAGEQLFVDLLPDSWVGVPPGLPQDVVDKLAQRARDAEKKARQSVLLSRQRKLPPIKVRLGTHPTFTRYVFEMPELIQVAVDRQTDKVTLLFDAPLQFDLVNVKAALPPTIGAITAEPGDDASEVTFAFNGKVDVRTFREEMNFILDVGASDTPAGAAVVADATPAKPGELAGLTLVPPGQKNAPAGQRPEPGAAGEKAAAGKPSGPATIPATPAPTLPREAAASPPPQAAPAGNRATAPPAAEPARTEPAIVTPQTKPAGPPAGAVASKTPEAAGGFPPVQGVTEPAGKSAGPGNPAPAGGATTPVTAELRRQGDVVRLAFPFTAPTPAAVFRRFDTVWLVFDTEVGVDVSALTGDPGRLIRSAEVTRTQSGQVVRLKLDRPRLASASMAGSAWSVALGDIALDRTVPVNITRATIGANRAVGVIPFDEPHALHRIADPEVGDTLLVVTALAPARGVLRTQELVEFRALASTHGIIIQPLADDITVELNRDKIIVARPSGLTLSAVSYELADEPSPSDVNLLFDANRWGADRQAKFTERQRQLMQAAAGAPDGKRTAARLDLARFYLGRELFPEAKAVLEVAVSEDKPTVEKPSSLMLRAIAKVMMDRNAEALQDLADPVLGNQKDAALWRALAHARQGKWVEAREGFKIAETAMRALPLELQRWVLKEELRAAIEVRDYADAAQALNELETIGLPRELQPSVAVLSGRLAEGLGRISDALTSYRSAAESSDLPAAAQAKLREILLRQSLKNITRDQAIAELESLTTVWRGDETEIEALRPLAHFYIEDQRYRDAFYILRTAIAAHPNSPVTRRIQDEAAATFEGLFLNGGADNMAPVEALSLFYDFRELTPAGKRGDEMIRRLSARLVSVDLLAQAAELLQHQVDNRLQGAARAQVATRLAVIYLMNRKPDRAFQVLRATRASDLSTELRNQRLLIEARALSDSGRHDLALEVIANLNGREVDRLRSDILWAARRWRESAEQLERLYRERWREFAPLNEVERPDILRAAVGYALGENQLDLDRLREKYGPKMAEGPLAKAFEVVTTPFATSGPEFKAIAKAAAAADTLEQFLRDLRARYPDGAPSAPPQPGEPQRSSVNFSDKSRYARVP